MPKKYNVYCVVPACRSNYFQHPNKIFVSIPKNNEVTMKAWCKAMRRSTVLSTSPSYYCCEDHFNVSEAMENYIEYTLMKGACKPRWKKGILPTRFECQEAYFKEVENQKKNEESKDQMQNQHILKKKRKRSEDDKETLIKTLSTDDSKEFGESVKHKVKENTNSNTQMDDEETERKSIYNEGIEDSKSANMHSNKTISTNNDVHIENVKLEITEEMVGVIKTEIDSEETPDMLKDSIQNDEGVNLEVLPVDTTTNPLQFEFIDYEKCYYD